MKFIAFSLWGGDPKYLEGAVENARLIPAHYPGSRALFLVGTCVPKETIAELTRLGSVVRRGFDGIECPIMWRHVAHELLPLDITLVRDTDSRANARAAKAVEEWVASGKGLHVMRDFPHHRAGIMGGMYGVRRPFKLNIYKTFMPWWDLNRSRFPSPFSRGIDSTFFREEIWSPELASNSVQHDSYFRDLFPGSVPFPTEAPRNGQFVGEIFENGCPITEHRYMSLGARALTDFK